MAIGTRLVEAVGHQQQRITDHGLRLFGFSMVGGVGVLVNNVLLFTFVEWAHINVIVASIMATEFAILNNFLLNDAFTFRGVRRDKPFLGRLASYNGLVLGGLVMSVLTLALLHYAAGVHYLLANVISIVPGTLWNYASNRRWTWSGGERDDRLD